MPILWLITFDLFQLDSLEKAVLMVEVVDDKKPSILPPNAK